MENDEKVVFIVLDCLSVDLWKKLSELLYNYYRIDTKYALSILPTSTAFSRNAIFSGYFPKQLQDKYPDIWEKMWKDEHSMNKYEETFLKDQLKLNGLEKKSVHYHKVLTYESGHKLGERIGEFKEVDVLAIVINFIDILVK